MTIFKLQRPLASNSPAHAQIWLAYSEGKTNVRMLPGNRIPHVVKLEMGDDQKAYFEAELIEGGDVNFKRRVEDQTW
jgi:hypothetical protein